jgi:DNA recombination protein RmuC
VLCSPLTLYAVLAVVRQAVDNFRLERTSNEILGLLHEFSLQWEKYVGQLDKVQQRFDQVGKEYTALMTTRHRALQRPLDRIEALRREPADVALLDVEMPRLA